MGGGAVVGPIRQVLDVAARLAPVPQHLDHAEQLLLVERVRVGGAQDRRVLVEVDAALEQRRVVHAGHTEHGP